MWVGKKLSAEDICTNYCANMSDHHTLKQTEAVLISVMPNAVWKIMYQKNGKQMNRWYLVMLSRP